MCSNRDKHMARAARSPKLDVVLVQLGGLEPPTSCSTDRRSNQLSYNCIPERATKGGSIWRETRCNARLWQGRKDGSAARILRKKSPDLTARAFRYSIRTTKR